MTCVVGLVKDGVVYLAGDTLGSAGYDCAPRKDVKVFKIGKFVIGYTTSYRMGQLLKCCFKPPKHPKKLSNFNYMVIKFIPAVQKLFKEGKFGKDSEGGNFLVGYNGELFNVMADFQVQVASENIDACGCGEAYALGALKALKDNTCKINPEQLLIKTLEIVTIYSNGVRGPFTLEHT